MWQFPHPPWTYVLKISHKPYVKITWIQPRKYPSPRPLIGQRAPVKAAALDDMVSVLYILKFRFHGYCQSLVPLATVNPRKHAEAVEALDVF
jgi:hypothetical protein